LRGLWELLQVAVAMHAVVALSYHKNKKEDYAKKLLGLP